MTSRCTRSSPALSSLRASTTVRARWTRRPRCTSNGPGRCGWRLGPSSCRSTITVGSGHPNIAYRRGCVAEPSAPSAPGRHRRYRRAANRSWRGYSRAHTVRTSSAGACTGSDGRRGAGAAATRGPASSLPRPRRRAHHLDLPHMRPDRLRAAAQQALYRAGRACGRVDFDGALAAHA